MLKIKSSLIRIASCAPDLRVADIDYNTTSICQIMERATKEGASILLFPELSLTGYTCGDLFTQSLLIDKVLVALLKVAQHTERYKITAIVGLPVTMRGRLYNCAAFLGHGKILGIVPKLFLPNTGEFYEKRWFTSGSNVEYSQVNIAGQSVPFGPELLFSADNIENCTIGIEICEDLWAVEPPSGAQALSGATILMNPSASDELLGKRAYRRDLVKLQSARCLAAYVYASAGPGESSTDVVYSGHCMVAENGSVIAESERFRFDSQIIYADIDLGKLQHERLCNSSFSTALPSRQYITLPFSLPEKNRANTGRFRPNSPTPFVPADLKERAASCHEIFSIQATGLAKRLKHINAKKAVIGISGGLDSTLALLVAVRAFDALRLDRKGIIAVTMPGMGTSNRTRNNAENLVKLLGAELRTISITDAIKQHFSDIGHDGKSLDITYENAQARERTQILMDIGNQTGGFVIGTGDLSEAALGWCTFNGDHMSMYHVNIGVPKTLVRYIIEWCAEDEFKGETSKVLQDICATPITPELLPVSKKGDIQQITEDIVGPYELHDYFLFHLVRNGEEPAKIFYLAEQAFAGRYDSKTLIKWLEVFIKRFFSQQFKRSAMPDGPKVGTVALSPRGDWRMPSDASVAAWLEVVNGLKKTLNKRTNSITAKKGRRDK
jgi:NAD+ synthase (glutamine-hydrolysing)